MKWMLLAVALAVLPAGAAAQNLPSNFNDSIVEGGLHFPVGMAWLPDGRLLVVQQSGAIRLLVNDALASTDPVATVDWVNNSGPERGLLGIAVDPGWPARPYVYIHCTSSSPAGVRVSRYTVTGDIAWLSDGALSIDINTRYDLINDIPDLRPNHNGGTVRFGPDGMLYVSIGEDDAGDATCHALNLDELRGKILRLDVSRLPAGPGGPPPRALIRAPGNPFATNPDSSAQLVWNYGLRNPFRFHIDTDGSLFIADVGENAWEEISRASAGSNLGWPRWEASREHTPSCPAPNALGPIYQFDRSGGAASVISGGVYRTPAGALYPFPARYEGDYFFSDYYFGFLRRLEGSGQNWSIAQPDSGQPNGTDWGTGYANVSDYLVGPQGRLWYCRQSVGFQANSGQIRRITYVGPPDPPTPAAPPPATFARPFPLPAVGAVNLSFALIRSASVSLRIYDGRGALVQTILPTGTKSAGTHDLIWDGRSADGRDAPAGLYFARLVADGQLLTQRIPMLR